MATATGGPFPGPSAMEVDNSVREPAPAATNLPSPNHGVSHCPSTAAPPTRNMSVTQNGVEPGSKRSIAFLLNAQEAPPAAEGAAHLPHNIARPSGQGAQVLTGKSW